MISLVEDAAPNPKFLRAAVRDLWRDRADVIERAAALQLEIFRLEESLTTLRARRQMFERSNIRPPVELDEIERELLGRVKEAKGEYSGLVDSLKAELLARYEEIGRRDLAMLPEDVRVERPLVKVAAVA